MIRSAAVALSLMVATAATAQPVPGTRFAPDSPSNAIALEARKYRRQITELREEAMRLRAADGGTLTPEHAAVLQQRLDALNARHADYQRRGCLGSHIECNDGS